MNKFAANLLFISHYKLYYNFEKNLTLLHINKNLYYRDIFPQHKTLFFNMNSTELKVLAKNSFHRWIALKIRNKQIFFEIIFSFGFKK